MKLHLPHPGGHTLSHFLFKGETEGAVVAEAAFAGKLLYDDGLSGRDRLTIEFHEVVDAQILLQNFICLFYGVKIKKNKMKK